MRKRDNFCIIVIIVVSLALLIVDIGRTFAFFVGPNGEIITSSFDGHYSFNGNYRVNNIPFNDTESDSVALQIEAGTFEVNQSNIDKSGDGSGTTPGINSAVFVQSEGIYRHQGGSIVTNGAYSDGVYVDGGRASLAGTSIQTKSHHSNGLVVTNNGEIIANYLNVETLGDDSVAINNISGNVIVNGGSYKTNGDRSPLILASGDVTVNQASTFVSEKSEGIIINGNHSVTFDNSSLTTTNTSLYNDINRSKGILLYQSSNKNNDYVAIFNATKSNITTNKGDTFYVTNTKATINLTNNTIVNNDGDFLRIESSSYGVSGNNGGDVLLNMSNQSVNGNIVIDEISKLEMKLVNGSSFEGSINSSNSSNDVILNLSSDSSIILTRDTYISSLENEDATNSNIHLNGHDLYVNGQKLVIGTGSSNGDGNNGGGTGTSDGTGSGSTNSNINGTTSGSTSGTVTSGSTATQGGSGNVDNGTGNGSSNGSAGEIKDNKKDSSTSSDKKIDGNNVSGETSEKDSTKSTGNKVKKKSSDNSISGGSKEITQEDLDEIDKNISNIDSNSSSIYVVDDKTLIIINLVGILLIATSSIYLIKNRVLKRINEV